MGNEEHIMIEYQMRNSPGTKGLMNVRPLFT